MLEIHDLVKTYRKTTALCGVSLTFGEGVYGLLGPNGSGKSTLMGILTANVRATSGTVLWDGTPVGRLGKVYRSIVGYVPQQQALYPDFTVTDFLYYVAALKGLPQKGLAETVHGILERVELSDVEDYRVRMLSGGMRQRLLIAQAVLGDPEILVMDEPTAGLDPKQRRQVCDLVRELSAGRILLVSTHIVSDLEYLGGTVLLLKKGVLVGQGSREELLEELQQKDPGAGVTSLDGLYLYYFGDE